MEKEKEQEKDSLLEVVKQFITYFEEVDSEEKQ